MQVKTLLNQVLKYKGFVYEKVSWEKGREGAVPEQIAVHLRPRKNSAAVCSVCEHACGVHDHLEERSFAFVPLAHDGLWLKWQIGIADKSRNRNP
jgi:hypothetical protein